MNYSNSGGTPRQFQTGRHKKINFQCTDVKKEKTKVSWKLITRGVRAISLRDRDQGTTGWEIQEGFQREATPQLMISINYLHHSPRRKALVIPHAYHVTFSFEAKRN